MSVFVCTQKHNTECGGSSKGQICLNPHSYISLELTSSLVPFRNQFLLQCFRVSFMLDCLFTMANSFPHFLQSHVPKDDSVKPLVRLCLIRAMQQSFSFLICPDFPPLHLYTVMSSHIQLPQKVITYVFSLLGEFYSCNFTIHISSIWQTPCSRLT